VKAWDKFQWERVGLNLRPELVFVQCESRRCRQVRGCGQGGCGQQRSSPDPGLRRRGRDGPGRQGCCGQKAPALCRQPGQRRTRWPPWPMSAAAPWPSKGANIEEVKALTRADRRRLQRHGHRHRRARHQGRLPGQRGRAPRRPGWQPHSGLPHHLLCRRNGRNPARADRGRGSHDSQIRGHRGDGRHHRRERVRASVGAPEHLHRPAAAHDRDRGHLRDQRTPAKTAPWR
jgi:hypothetical protein